MPKKIKIQEVNSAKFLIATPKFRLKSKIPFIQKIADYPCTYNSAVVDLPFLSLSSIPLYRKCRVDNFAPIDVLKTIPSGCQNSSIISTEKAECIVPD